MKLLHIWDINFIKSVSNVHLLSLRRQSSHDLAIKILDNPGRGNNSLGNQGRTRRDVSKDMLVAKLSTSFGLKAGFCQA